MNNSCKKLRYKNKTKKVSTQQKFHNTQNSTIFIQQAKTTSKIEMVF